ncbi:hypothetical protein DTO013E5_9378 [Penicillium roqueforti]|uniref:Genomic scaffold, ProqFM164S02 n=1 Tax=Penicillium roqueforti (strain FM164) TaxID=1365484 RepID=W6QTR4_PENRF|nr:uncharacterized protein LCP9604111_9439 [Penicillium roqueforti]CDM32932.1 unnamed protein product [Penicillium roqueforti FM164]KAF9238413.1 hypothetical protein LCP9604111_9439 [Penicillium roqueforti]KAI1828995.1 hypothetical protein CBS147337_10201 [Penicillium roqueforti]KAI2669613.1 hypothetical protein CBS147355_9774 [Penicillium roqueforti]KAI2675705.1 hypothetical protein LCP963914a_8542 [Penicillium roqueforti]
MAKSVIIMFEDPDSWENERENVDSILDKYTGTSGYPSTRSLPPIIVGAELGEEAVEELRSLSGVLVRCPDEEED